MTAINVENNLTKTVSGNGINTSLNIVKISIQSFTNEGI